MSIHIETVKKAIEFKKPDYLPMEIQNVPGIYNAYHTLDPETVKFIPGTEDFDSIWTNCYSWFHKDISKTPKGEPIRLDQFGTKIKIPNDQNSTYILLKHPLEGRNSLKGFDFPNPDKTDPYYEKLGKVIRGKYSDRFICGFIDAGVFMTTQFLIGINDFFLKLATNTNFVVEVYESVADYYMKLIPKYKKAGAHMITIIEDLGSNQGLLLNPDLWRKKFKPILTKMFKFIHEQGLYSEICIDGDAKDILDDLLEMEIDQFFLPDINTTGIKILKEKIRGKMSIKATVDMKTTLASGTQYEVEKEAHELVENLNTPNGGLMCEVVRWHRPEYPSKNILASVKGFNKYRKSVE